MNRHDLLHAWLRQCLPNTSYDIEPLAGDASFRRYFRLYNGARSYVVMDAPPHQEDCRSFILVANVLRQKGVITPEIIHQDLEQGFLLLSDFGDDLYLSVLNSQNADQLYQRGLQTLQRIQSCQASSVYSLPHFDAPFINMELNRFVDWFWRKLLGCKPSQFELNLFDKLRTHLITNAIEQPQVFIHRDYHSRNLFVLPTERVGVIDFQDAMWGPITYDLVSLLRDCYIVWPNNKVKQWVVQYIAMLKHKTDYATLDDAQFWQWFEWQGVQRHIKVLGIFARLHLRDQKTAYLHDIPRILNYLSEVTSHYVELQEFNRLLCDSLKPKFETIFLKQNTRQAEIGR